MTRRAATLVDGFLEEAIAEGATLEDGGWLGLAAVATTAPSALRARLVDTIGRTHRFDDLEDVVAEMADLSIERTRELLLDVDRAHVWEPGITPEITLRHFEGGPKVRNAVTGLVRIAPGGTFPQHSHVGDERVLVLQGAFEDDDGHVYRAGEMAPQPAGSAHSFRAVGPLPLVTVAIVEGGVIIGGVTIPPGDPRG